MKSKLVFNFILILSLFILFTQNGLAIPVQNPPPVENTMLDWGAMEEKYSDYTPTQTQEAPGGISFKGLDTSDPYTPGRRASSYQDVDDEKINSLEELNKFATTPGDVSHSGKLVPLSELNYDVNNSLLPGDYNNDDAYGQNQLNKNKYILIGILIILILVILFFSANLFTNKKTDSEIKKDGINDDKIDSNIVGEKPYDVNKIISLLDKIQSLKERNVITEQQFERLKRELID